MDPTIPKIIIQNSFRGPVMEPVKLNPYLTEPSATFSDTIGVAPNIQLLPLPSIKLSPIAVDTTLYSTLESLKNEFAKYRPEDFRRARSDINPFENLPGHVFMDRAGYKLANIDAVYNITGSNGGYIAPQTAGIFSYCDLAGGPGAWTQYLQYRRPEAEGFGITLKVEGNLAWNERSIDLRRFNILYGDDGTGNLYTNFDSFVAQVKRFYPIGVDLVVADGGLDVEGRESYQEILNSRLILAEALTALKTVKMGGYFVCKLYDTVTPLMADLLYLISTCFASIDLFKPLSSRPANSEKYLVAKGKFDSIYTRIQVSILETAYRSYTNDKMVITLLQSQPDSFSAWLTQKNNLFTRSTYLAGRKILQYLQGEPVNVEAVDLYKCLALFNLPDKSIFQGEGCTRCPVENPDDKLSIPSPVPLPSSSSSGGREEEGRREERGRGRGRGGK